MVAVVVLVVLCVGSYAEASGGVQSRSDPFEAAIDPILRHRLAAAEPEQMVKAIVVLDAQADLAPLGTVTGEGAAARARRLRLAERALRKTATSSQTGVLDLLDAERANGNVSQIQPLWIVDAVEIAATPAVIEELAGRGDVREIQADLRFFAPSSMERMASASAETNVALINAPALWDLGFRGQGVVVASMDTGVDVTHPELAGRWRGGTNSWYDPNGEHPSTPTDVNGHGTWTMGAMVGGDAGGSSIGVAPDARWIAVKIFNDQGTATSSGIHLGFQWLLDPDGNPATADAPNVLNNSWTMSTAGCNLDFQPDLQNLRAAGILPIFAAGNFGPMPGTSVSPANNPEALAVGSTDDSDLIDTLSGRGPSACAQPVYPQLVAPGVDIRTTDLFGLYVNETGTSMAAPHVAGALALLLGAFPGLSADRQEAALENGAADLGTAGADNDYGFGRLDAAASYQWTLVSPDFSVSASPASVNAVAGTTAVSTISINGTNGFAGDVALSLAGLPSGVGTSTITPAIVNGAGSAQLSIQILAGAIPGTYQLMVTGNNGPTTRFTPVTLVVSAPAPIMYLSIHTWGARTLGTLTGVQNEDVVSFDGSRFTMTFDGSDVGLSTVDLDAFSRVDPDSFLLSFDKPISLPRVGWTDDSDVVRFDATSIGTTTAGLFSMYLDGSDVGLTMDMEDIDAIEPLADGRLLISTRGWATVTGAGAMHEDLLAFTPTLLGGVTKGTFRMYFDGSDVGLSGPSEDVDGVAVDGSGSILLSTLGAFAVPGVTGLGEDIFVCTPSSLGPNTLCVYSSAPFFQGSAWGLAGLGLDAFELP
jgi:subtilisin family serine protease